MVKIPESVFLSRDMVAYSAAVASSGMCVGSFNLFADLSKGIRVIVGSACFMVDRKGWRSWDVDGFLGLSSLRYTTNLAVVVKNT